MTAADLCHWQRVRLRYLAQLNPSKSEVADLAKKTAVSFLPMEAVGENGELDLRQHREIGAVENGYTYLRDGDVAYAKITPCFENGKAAEMAGLTEGIAFGTTELTVLRPRTDKCLGRFLYWIIKSPEFAVSGEATMTGAGGQKRVPDNFARNFEIACPPLPEQRAIAGFLDRETAKIDALVEEQRRLIALLKEKRQAVISHAVTKGLDPAAPMKPSGIDWLGDIPAHWEITQLKRLVKGGTSITYGIVQAGPMLEAGIPYIRTSDMSGEVLPSDGYPLTSPEIEGAYERSRVFPGDLVIAIRATIGQVLPVPDDLPMANLTQGTAKFSPGVDILRDFACHVLGADAAQHYFSLHSKGATFKEITLDALRRLPVVLPPLEEQAEITACLDAEVDRFGQLTSEATRAITLLQERRSALISAAVTGKIDVRDITTDNTEAA